MRPIATGLTLVVAVVSIGCGGSTASSGETTTTAAVRQGWDPAAVERARSVADATVGVPEGCRDGDVEVHEWEPLADSHAAARLPMPDASVGCETADEGDLFVEVFADAEAKDTFVAAKESLLCERGRQRAEGLDVPFRVPYVDGGDWIIEPDSTEAAEALAPVTGGTAHDICD